MIVRVLRWIGSRVPVPRAISDEPPVVDPRVDPEALETYGRAQIGQFGVGQSHSGAAPLPTQYATDLAAEARADERRRVDE